MLRYIVPIILIVIAGAGFILFTNPIFKDISEIKNEIASYNEALNNAKSLENERDKLTKKYNAINPNDLSKLQKFLPDNVDNIRLILEIEKIASPYGMVLKDVKYDVTEKESTIQKQIQSGAVVNPLMENEDKEYGTLDLEFSTEGKYSSFVDFVKDLESNLRIVDISSIVFSSDVNLMLGKVKVQPLDSYKYDFKIKTYWLKN